MPGQQWFESKIKDQVLIKFDNEQGLACQIEEVNESPAPSTKAGQHQFSVIFSKPNAEVFQQGLYQVSHPDVGEMSLFLVPVYGDDEGVHYEAIFT